MHGGIGNQNHANKPIQTVLYNTDDSWLCRYPFCLIADNLFLHWAYITKPEIFKQIYIGGVTVCRNLSRLQKKQTPGEIYMPYMQIARWKTIFKRMEWLFILHGSDLFAIFVHFCQIISTGAGQRHVPVHEIYRSLYAVVSHWQEVSVNVLLRMVLLVT